jgi:hypothetical protein
LEQARRDGPAAAIVRYYGDGLLVIARHHALNAAAIIGLEPNAIADPEFEHITVRAHLADETEAFDDPMVEVYEFGLAERVDVDLHRCPKASPRGRDSRRDSMTLALFRVIPSPR